MMIYVLRISYDVVQNIDADDMENARVAMKVLRMR